MTAEAAAEIGKKPLMVVSAAELGSKGADLEEYLGSMLEICDDWDAVLLIDEAEATLNHVLWATFSAMPWSVCFFDFLNIINKSFS